MKSPSRILIAVIGVTALLFCGSCTGSGVQFEMDQSPAVVTVVEEGWRLESSLTLEDGEYFCAAVAGPSTGALEGAAISIEGKREVVLDLRGVVLRGAERDAPLDSLRGIGVLIRDCENVRVLGGTIGGYRVPIRVLRSRGVLIDGTNFDGWYADPLVSTARQQDPADQISFEAGAKNEGSTARFESYGAAVAVASSSRVTIRGSRGRHGQNGILLEDVKDSSVVDSDFSFLSGWGCALFDSNRNEISHNIFDYCVRGFSEGVHDGGLGSAGILLGGACRTNVIAECSATHCGDGLRIMSLGSEGSVGNTVSSCDFSYAADCGVRIEGPSEADAFVSNQLANAANHAFSAERTTELICHDNVMPSARKGGIRLIDSERALISDNQIEDTECGIAIEPSNAAGTQGGDDHWLIHNVLGRNLADLRLRLLTNLRIERNRFGSPAGRLEIDGLSDAELGVVIAEREALERIMGRFDVPPAGLLSDVSLANLSSEASGNSPSRQLRSSYIDGRGPDVRVSGKRSTRAADRGLDLRDHASIVLGKWGPWDFRAEESRPSRHGSSRGPLRTGTWQALWFHWNSSQDPRGDLNRWRSLRFDPVAERKFQGGSWTSPYGIDAKPEHAKQIGYERFGLFARASFRVEEAGRYRLETVSDDGVRVTIDGQVVLENWTWHPRTLDACEVELTAGEHELDLEYFQIDGASVLTLDLEPLHRVRQRSAGE